MRKGQPLPVIPVTLLLAFQAACSHAFEVFNDGNPETEALKIWQITNDRTIRHHFNYHNIDPFSPDGRYIIYTIHSPKRSTWQVVQKKLPPTFAVFDLHTKQEVFHARGPATRPIWARKKNVVYWVQEGARGKSRVLCRLDLSGDKVPSALLHLN